MLFLIDEAHGYYGIPTKTVVHILERLDYLGHTVNFKTSKQSFKSKKVLWNDPADWVIFENTQEPIIEESVFLIVQKIRQGRRRPTKMGDMGMFSGLLFCADCGGKMYLCRANHFKPEQEYYLFASSMRRLTPGRSKFVPEYPSSQYTAISFQPR